MSRPRPRTAGLQAIDIPVPVVLASRSAERRRLLAGLLRRFDVVEPHVEERASLDKGAEAVVLEHARAKAEEVSHRRPDALVIGADTVVDCGGELLGKPSDRRDAVRMLTRLVCRPHRVVSGVFVIAPDGRRRSALSVAHVRMRRLPRAEIESYVEREDVLQRAGAYALQERDPNVESLRGSPSAVMGLPLEDLARILTELYPPGA